MSQKEDKGPHKPPSTSISHEQAERMATAYLPPISAYGSQARELEGIPFGDAEFSWTGGQPRVSQSNAGIPENRLSGPQRQSSPTRRRPGAAPLSDILLQEPASPILGSQTLRRDAPGHSSPTSPQHPDLGPLRIHSDPRSPERTRHGYFDPARSISERSPTSGAGQPGSDNPLQRGMGQPLQSLSEDINTTGSPSASSASTRLSPIDRSRMRLVILQQPRAARACGHGERDRRVIDPPPVLQLKLQDYDSTSAHDRDLLRSKYNMVHCTLLSVSDRDAPIEASEDVSRIHDPNDPNKDLRRLMGSLTIDPFIGDDMYASRSIPKGARVAPFYIFFDLSCRVIGLYRLRFTMLPVQVQAVQAGGRIEAVTTVDSDVFEVFSAKDFPGMSASSELIRELKRQGASVPVKKGNESKRGRRTRRRGSDTDGSDSDASDDAGMSTAAGKKPRS